MMIESKMMRQMQNRKESDWSEQKQKRLFELHSEYGNKWTIIAAIMQGTNQFCIKNKFYSTLRKGFRKLNAYIVNVKRKIEHGKPHKSKEIDALFLTKLISVADRSHQEKYEAKEIAIHLSRGIQAALIELGKTQVEYETLENISYQQEDDLLQNVLQFNKNCKKRKGKKKINHNYHQYPEIEPQEQQQVKHQIIQEKRQEEITENILRDQSKKISVKQKRSLFSNKSSLSLQCFPIEEAQEQQNEKAEQENKEAIKELKQKQPLIKINFNTSCENLRILPENFPESIFENSVCQSYQIQLNKSNSSLATSSRDYLIKKQLKQMTTPSPQCIENGKYTLGGMMEMKNVTASNIIDQYSSHSLSENEATFTKKTSGFLRQMPVVQETINVEEFLIKSANMSSQVNTLIFNQKDEYFNSSMRFSIKQDPMRSTQKQGKIHQSIQQKPIQKNMLLSGNKEAELESETLRMPKDN